jgi:hypothetical protein
MSESEAPAKSRGEAPAKSRGEARRNALVAVLAAAVGGGLAIVGGIVASRRRSISNASSTVTGRLDPPLRPSACSGSTSEAGLTISNHSLTRFRPRALATTPHSGTSLATSPTMKNGSWPRRLRISRGRRRINASWLRPSVADNGSLSLVPISSGRASYNGSAGGAACFTARHSKWPWMGTWAWTRPSGS